MAFLFDTGRIKERSDREVTLSFTEMMSHNFAIGEQFFSAQEAIISLAKSIGANSVDFDDRDVGIGALLTPQQANERYGAAGLNFDSPVWDFEAQRLAERAELKRVHEAVLKSAESGTLSAIGAFGAEMVGSLLNPIDAALSLLPVSSGVAAGARVGGRAIGLVPKVGKSMARPLQTTARIADNFTFGRGSIGSQMAGAAIDGSIGNAIAEIPIHINRGISQDDPTYGELVLNIGAGAAFSAGLNLAGRLLARTTRATRERLFRHQQNLLENGKGVGDFEDFIEMDPKTIKREARSRIARRNLNDVIRDLGLDDVDMLRARGVPRFSGPANEEQILAIAEDVLLRANMLGRQDEVEFKNIADTLRRLKETDSEEIVRELARDLNLEFDRANDVFPAVTTLDVPEGAIKVPRKPAPLDRQLNEFNRKQLTFSEKELPFARTQEAARKQLADVEGEIRRNKIQELVKKGRLRSAEEFDVQQRAADPDHKGDQDAIFDSRVDEIKDRARNFEENDLDKQLSDINRLDAEEAELAGEFTGRSKELFDRLTGDQRNIDDIPLRVATECLLGVL